ncbi:hypothetical protein GOODEAATRI_022725 [Goodea atripinnis]|uniref:Uncharacterized protein n=1 Tax=Goodea atripinnis TaxID=208336 RepID=A0ABV0NMF5_9TELE
MLVSTERHVCSVAPSFQSNFGFVVIGSVPWDPHEAGVRWAYGAAAAIPDGLRLTNDHDSVREERGR